MDEEYKSASRKIFEFEFHGAITSDQKATLASVNSRLLHEAIRKRDALEVLRIQEMESRLDAIKTIETPYQIKEKEKRKVFIVHGHNGEMKHAVARVLEKLGLEAVILSEKTNLGRALIEKLIDNGDVGYAVILVSPDDMGFLKDEGHEKARPRARQNVIFELGYFLGKNQKSKIAVIYLVTPDFEFPSDLDGVAYIPYDEYESWKYSLVAELKASEFDVDANKLLPTH